MKLVVVSVQRPIFRGDKTSAFANSCARLAAVAARAGFELEPCPTPVTGPDEAAAVAAELSAAKPALVLVQATTFATFDCFQPLLETGLATALWAIAEPATTGPLPLNSFCGANFVLSLEQQACQRLPWLYGDADDPLWAPRFADLLAAARALARLRTAKVLLIGGTAPTFDRFKVEPKYVEEVFGASVERLGLPSFFERVAAVKEPELGAAVDSLRAEGADQLNEHQLRAAARLDVALQRLGDQYDAIALRCWPEVSEETGSMPCASVARLLDRGCPTACEGDVLGALSMLAIGAIAQSDPVLMDLSHITPEHLLFWHCGNAPRSLAAAGSRLGTHFNRPELGAVREMVLAPGPTTMLRFTDLHQIAVFEASWQPGGPDFDGVTGRLADVRWDGDEALAPHEVVARVFDHHLPHHYAFATGHHAGAVKLLGDWLQCLRLASPQTGALHHCGRLPELEG